MLGVLVTCIIIVVVALVAIKILEIFAAQIDARLAAAIKYVICGIALIALIKAILPLVGHGGLL